MSAGISQSIALTHSRVEGGREGFDNEVGHSESLGQMDVCRESFFICRLLVVLKLQESALAHPQDMWKEKKERKWTRALQSLTN